MDKHRKVFPTVCHQTQFEHTHYNFVFIKDHPNRTVAYNVLRTLSQEVGGATPGDVILAIQAQVALGIPISRYGLFALLVESLQLDVHCFTGLPESPVLDWNKLLISVIPNPSPPIVIGCPVGYIDNAA